MTTWGSVLPVAVGGLVCVGFLDEQRVVVGIHSGVGLVDARSGRQIGVLPDVDGSYSWFSDEPPSATWADVDGQRTVPVAGLWGGSLPEATTDGWRCQRSASGATLAGPDGATLVIDDDEDFRACGFSPQGDVFVYATSPTLYLLTRTTP